MSEPRRRLEGAEEEVRKLLAEMPTGSAVGLGRDELDRLLLVLERMARKAAALARLLEAARSTPPASLH